jgi:hypothetical protein
MATFARFGRVGEVYIPNKVDKQGKRFGFVKFREVRDEVELLRMLWRRNSLLACRVNESRAVELSRMLCWKMMRWWKGV